MTVEDPEALRKIPLAIAVALLLAELKAGQLTW